MKSFLFSMLMFSYTALSAYEYKNDQFVLKASMEESKGQTKLQFKFELKDKFKLNYDAPWKLEFDKKFSSYFEKILFDKKDMDKGLPGFTILTKKNSKAPKAFNFQLKAYSCTKDGLNCFPPVTIRGELGKAS